MNKTQKYWTTGGERRPPFPDSATHDSRSRSPRWPDDTYGRIPQKPASTERVRFRRRGVTTSHLLNNLPVNTGRQKCPFRTFRPPLLPPRSRAKCLTLRGFALAGIQPAYSCPNLT